MKELKMTNINSYLIRAFCEWIIDNNDIAIIVVDKKYLNETINLQDFSQIEIKEDVLLLSMTSEIFNKSKIGVDKTNVILNNKILEFPTYAILSVFSEKYNVIQYFQLEEDLKSSNFIENKNKKPNLRVVKNEV